jgi:hypothetical protein
MVRTVKWKHSMEGFYIQDMPCSLHRTAYLEAMSACMQLHVSIIIFVAELHNSLLYSSVGFNTSNTEHNLTCHRLHICQDRWQACMFQLICLVVIHLFIILYSNQHYSHSYVASYCNGLNNSME